MTKKPYVLLRLATRRPAALGRKSMRHRATFTIGLSPVLTAEQELPVSPLPVHVRPVNTCSPLIKYQCLCTSTSRIVFLAQRRLRGVMQESKQVPIYGHPVSSSCISETWRLGIGRFWMESRDRRLAATSMSPYNRSFGHSPACAWAVSGNSNMYEQIPDPYLGYTTAPIQPNRARYIPTSRTLKPWRNPSRSISRGSLSSPQNVGAESRYRLETW